MENACTPLMKLPPCSQPKCSLQPRASTRTVQNTRSARMECSVVQCSAVSPTTWTSHARKSQHVQSKLFLLCGSARRITRDRGRNSKFSTWINPANLHFYKRRQKATKSAWRNALWAARRGSIGADSPRTVRRVFDFPPHGNEGQTVWLSAWRRWLRGALWL